MIDDEDRELRRALACYQVPDVSPEIADGVMQRLAGRPRANHRGRYVAAVVAVAAAVAIGAVTLRGGSSVEGRHATLGRETIALGARGAAVVEGGADVRWRIAGDDAAHVEQRSGSVFYRVEPGGPFVVETPAGTVEVRGTCFRVEVEAMKVSRQHVFGAGLGAAVAAIAAIVVYEGEVRVVNARGSVELAAGERGRVESGSAPERESGAGRGSSAAGGLARLGADASRAELLAANETSRAELASAQAKIDGLERQLAALRIDTGQVSRVEPTKEQLAEWAQRCEIHIDAPGVFGSTAAPLGPQEAAKWGLTAAEASVLDHALAELHPRVRDEMREIYVSVTGNAVVGDEITAGAMFDEIYDKALASDLARAHQNMARERAGLQAPPANLKALPAIERALRLVARLGTDFERLVGVGLGVPRSREVRKRYNGWPGMRLDNNNCEEPPR